MTRDWFILPLLGFFGLFTLLFWLAEVLFARDKRRVVTGRRFLLAVGLLAGAIGLGPRWDEQYRRTPEREACTRKLRQLAYSLLFYTLEHDDQFPPAAVWSDVAAPRLKGNQPFRCPTDRRGATYSYAFNVHLSGVSYPALQPAAQAVMLFESTKDEANARDAGESLARQGRHAQYRLFGAGPRWPDPNWGVTPLVFADGHVEWWPLAEVPPAGTAFWKPPMGRPTPPSASIEEAGKKDAEP